jgi:quercetin dioxygenase-like cupin family protein
MAASLVWVERAVWRWQNQEVTLEREIAMSAEATKDMSFVKSEDVRSFTPEPGMVRQVLAHNPKLMLIRHFFEQGWVGAKHAHPHEQLVYVVQGKIRVEIAGRPAFDVSPGESFVVEGDVEHQAWALEESEVLDVFTPVREDYMELVKG